MSIHTRTTSMALLIAGSLLALRTQAQMLVAIDPAGGRAAGINASGDVILGTHFYSGGVLTPLGSGYLVMIGGPVPDATPMYDGNAINDNGQIVGAIQYHGAFRAVNGTITDVGVRPPYDPSFIGSTLYAINNAGMFAGLSGGAGKVIAVYGTLGGVMQTIIPPYPNVTSFQSISTAYGINDAGFVTGFGIKDTGSVVAHVAFLFDTATSTWTEVTPGEGRAINASNEITGVGFPDLASTANSCGHAFLRKANGTVLDLDRIGGACSVGLAINDDGDVVGSSQFAAGNTATRAFYYNGAMQDLNDMVPANDPLKATVTLTEARGINEDRLIVANGFASGNPTQVRAYLLQASAVNFTNGTLAFGSHAVLSTTPAQVATLTNNGTAPVAIAGIAAEGEFTETHTCGATLNAGASCTFNIVFAPVTAGEHRGGVSMTIDGLRYRIRATGSTPLQLSLALSSANGTVGVPFTLTWTITPGATCRGLGGDGDITPSRLAWVAEKTSSGSMQYTPTRAGNLFFALQCTVGTEQQTTDEISFSSVWPPVTASISAAPASIASGAAVTLTWSSANADSCTASGGDAGDTWAGSRATSGTATVTPVATSSSRALGYSITCASAGSGFSGSASVTVTQNPPAAAPAPPSGGGGGSTVVDGGGGGGALDTPLLAVLGLLLLAAQMQRRSSQWARRPRE